MEAYQTLPRRAWDTHKGDYGKLLILGGSVGYSGAPNLCARAAVRAGAGLVSLGVPEPIWAIAAMKQEEAMPFPLPAEEGGLSMSALDPILRRMRESDLCVLGPGMGRSAARTRLVQSIIRQTPVPLVLDADALFAAAQAPEVLRASKQPIYLTPHDGEFARFQPEPGQSRREQTVRLAIRCACTVIRKGPETVIAFPDGTSTVLRVGNPGMAKGGSGDVLAGMLGAFLCQLEPPHAVPAAVWAHGRAGDLCAERFGEYGMTPSDLIDLIPAVTKEMVEAK